MSNKPASNGIQDGRANVEKFLQWQQEVEDFKPYIRQGTLSISRVAAESGLNRNVFYTNPEIRDQLMPELEATLLARGLLSARSSVPTTLTVDRASSGSKLAGSENKRLIEQIEAYRAEIDELRRQLQRREVVQSLLAESGRLPW